MSEYLSSFHAELIGFISRDVSERAVSEGFDEVSDPELKSFQKSLETVQDEGQVAKLLEEYAYIFKTRGPLYLEKKLIDAFSFKEAREERMRIYRGLPRLYRQARPSESRLKQNFTHLPTLKRLAVEKAVFRLYSTQQAMGKVSIFTWVMTDGWGDYMAGLDMIEILKHRLPELQLGWVVLFPKRLGSPPIPAGVKTNIIYYDEDLPSHLNREALEMLRTSDLVIQAPTFYPSFDILKQMVEEISFSLPPPTWLSIGEYGFVESEWFHPLSGNRSMGLHFLEKGILIETPVPTLERKFTEIANFDLLNGLFSSATPSDAQVESYKKTHHFYLAYLTTQAGGVVYLHALAKAHELDPMGIDLCCPDIGWLIRHIELQTRGGLPLFEIDGVSLELHHQGKITPLTKKTDGKRIRIFCPAALSAPDFQLLVHLSGEWVAVRGDQSFSEVVSMNKGFFYDGRHHARYFLKDLLALAENRIGMHTSTLEVLRGMGKAFLHNLPADQGEWVEETYFQTKEPLEEIATKMGLALRDPDCLVGFKKLNRILMEEHAFNDFLCHLVQRELCHRDHPEKRLLEEEILRPFIEGRRGFTETMAELRANL
jgi:hypothetical protein